MQIHERWLWKTGLGVYGAIRRTDCLWIKVLIQVWAAEVSIYVKDAQRTSDLCGDGDRLGGFSDA